MNRQLLTIIVIASSCLKCSIAGFVKESNVHYHGRRGFQAFERSGSHYSIVVQKISLLASGANSDSTSPIAKEPQLQHAPVLNGKRVLPFQVITPGLQGHKVFAVYAVLNAQYKRGTEGWESCEYVGVTDDLDATLRGHRDQYGASKVAHIRALSFAFPQEKAMQDVAREWRDNVVQAGGSLGSWKEDDSVLRAMERAIFDDEEAEDDDDDDDNDDWNMEMSAQAMAAARTVTTPRPIEAPIVSPFAVEASPPDLATTSDVTSYDTSGELAFTQDNVNRVLEEVRPYLIADGGNVAVERVDSEKRDVYLKLQGACGSCPSSTVTMQMGIERLLKEKFPDLGQVLQVQDDNVPPPATELTWEAVLSEVNRIKPAIMAMGGIIEVVKVDPIGVVDLKFRGSNKIRQGLELAIRDVPFVKHVNFVMGDN